MRRDDFKTATLAAPEWVRDALHTTNGLETQLKVQTASPP